MIKSFIGRLWAAILRCLGLCTIKEADHKLQETITKLDDKALKCVQDITTSYDEKLSAYESELNDIRAKADSMKKLYQDTFTQCDRYRQEVPTENLAIIKNLQGQLAEVYNTSRNFGFPNSLALPGSATMTDNNVQVDGENYTSVRVRMILTDDETARINTEPDQKRRYAMSVDMLRRRGLLERLGERMITSGAATLAIAYNMDCTNYELFVDVAAKILPDAGTIIITKDVQG